VNFCRSTTECKPMPNVDSVVGAYKIYKTSAQGYFRCGGSIEISPHGSLPGTAKMALSDGTQSRDITLIPGNLGAPFLWMWGFGHENSIVVIYLCAAPSANTGNREIKLERFRIDGRHLGDLPWIPGRIGQCPCDTTPIRIEQDDEGSGEEP
jgi:hypothetical protein